MFQTNLVEKIKARILYLTTFPRWLCCLWDNVGKYGRARQATDDSIIRRMHIACWIPKATDKYSEYVIIFLPRQRCLHERASVLCWNVHWLAYYSPVIIFMCWPTHSSSDCVVYFFLTLPLSEDLLDALSYLSLLQ